MNWWILSYLALGVLGIGVHLALHGRPREDNYNFFIAAIGWGLTVWLLYMGGAFNAMS